MVVVAVVMAASVVLTATNLVTVGVASFVEAISALANAHRRVDNNCFSAIPDDEAGIAGAAAAVKTP